MRDLKADLSRLDKLGHVCMEMNYEEYEQFVQTYHRDWLKRAVHEQKRADKAEALAQELVAALQGVSGMLDYGTGECRCGVCEYCNVQKRADKALTKAKKVLGDGN
mgnify:CR=1 FL=1